MSCLKKIQFYPVVIHGFIGDDLQGVAPVVKNIFRDRVDQQAHVVFFGHTRNKVGEDGFFIELTRNCIAVKFGTCCFFRSHADDGSACAVFSDFSQIERNDGRTALRRKIGCVVMTGF